MNSEKWNGHDFQAARELAGLTRKDLAARLEITESTLFRWEKQGRAPHAVFQRALWAALEIPLDVEP